MSDSLFTAHVTLRLRRIGGGGEAVKWASTRQFMSEEDWERIQLNEPVHVTLNLRRIGKECSQMSKHTPLWWELERIQPNEPAHATLCLRRIGKEYSQMNQHTSLYIWGGLGKDTPKWTTTRHFISEENLKEYSQMNQHMSLYIWGGLGKNTAKWTSTYHFYVCIRGAPLPDQIGAKNSNECFLPSLPPLQRIYLDQ